MAESIPPNAVQVTDQEIQFLTILQRSIEGHKIRLLFYPAPNRSNKVNPTHVVIVSEEPVFLDYVLFELEKFRRASQQAIKQLRGF